MLLALSVKRPHSMDEYMKMPLPRHIGFIPDGNRRWAVGKGMEKQDGYAFGIAPGLALVDICQKRGIEEISIYGYTQDNTRRASVQKDSFSSACVQFAQAVANTGVALLVVGDKESRLFPSALQSYTRRQGTGIKVNLLVNYGWDWDLEGLRTGDIRSKEVSRIDLIVRWGGGRRLSGFLPVQSVYADIFVVDDYWPDFHSSHIDAAFAWYRQQDRSLGG